MPEEKPKRTRKAAAKPDSRPALMPSGVTPDERWSLGLVQYNPDAVVRANGLKIYREMIRRDPVIALGLQYLETARLSRGWSIEAGEGERAKEIAAFTTYALANIKGTERDLLHDLLDALGMGFAVVEKVPIVYDTGPYAGKWGYSHFAAKWQESIELRIDEFGELQALQYKQFSAKGSVPDIEGDDLARFIVYVPNRQKGNWYGESILRPIYRVYTIKDHLTRYLAVHMEKFGSGVIVQKSAAMSGDKQTILDNLVKQHGAMAYVIGTDEELAIIYPPPGVGDGLVSAIEHCNAEIMKGLSLPQTLFSGTGGSGEGGSRALSESHERTFAEVVDRIGRSLEDCIDEQVIRPLVEWNWPSVGAEEVPHLRFVQYQEEDGAAKLERLKVAREMGADLLLDEVYDAAGASRPAEDTEEEEIVTGKGKGEPVAIPPQLPFNPAGPREMFAEAERVATEFERKVNFGEILSKTDALVDLYLAKAQEETAAVKDVALAVIAEEMGERKTAG